MTWGLVSSTEPTITDWRGEYFNNTTLSGPPVLVRNDAEINFAWDTAAPAPQVNQDNFSVRWSRTLTLPAGNYRFTMTVDDGARLFVNGHTLIDAWKEQAPTTYPADLALPGGAVTVQMEYFERGGGATAQLRWQRLDAPTPTSTPYAPPTVVPITEWRAEYFNNRTLSGAPAAVRNDRTIDFDWGTDSPITGTINPDEFSVRWLQTLSLPAGTYRFTTTVDDGVRLYLNGRLLIENWQEQAPTTTSDTVYLSGPVAVEMQYFEAYGGATARLRWELVDGGGTAPTPTLTARPYPSPTPTPRPYPTPTAGARGTVIVDNSDVGFVKGGDPSGWQSVGEGYNGNLLWSRNNDRNRPNYNWGRWYPQLQPGYYEVYVYIPFRYTTTGNALYWVAHADGYTQRSVSQSANGDRWVSLGSYRFQGNEHDYVSLADITFEYRLSRLIAWDAMKWEPR
ncbi:MAG: PA14 domain-containing protein [Caldilineaceae bacterium]